MGSSLSAHRPRGKIGRVTDAKTPDEQAGDQATAIAFDVDDYDLSDDVAALPDDIDQLRLEIDRLDAMILASVKRRSAVSKKIGAARMASGGPRLVHSREVKVLDRFAELGQEGHTLAMLLLRLGRGPLGR
ncbi:putative chorismate mutase [Gordonia rhizosphera NBRC 16068]|uniref:Putative chorismate mutase n=1 Tax=Gordonia rhizosphera NBRC 16068 TaxID=1108045 RepID=K6WSC1_9ACTN|nr:putative chorismate mutase [Gordonia rhizosphera NBRC 16068]